jgi:hypothetical protein
MGVSYSFLQQQVFLSLIIKNFKFYCLSKNDIEINTNKGMLSPNICDIKFIEIQ